MGAHDVSFGSFIKRKRMELGLTLREFCELNGYDPGNYSRVERGVSNPPQDAAALNVMAKALKVHARSEEFEEFTSLAAVANGQIPASLLNDAEVLKRLPVLFRTIGSKPVAPEKLDELIDLIRRS